MTVVITGANGFIGSHLAKYFQDRGWNVIALTRKEFDLNKQPDEKYFQNADALIHCAYKKNSFEENIDGTKRLLEISRKCGIKKNIFLSSFSAREEAISKYGRQKFTIEKLFNSETDCSVRAGVVLGNGGLFRQMSEHIRKGKFIPLIDGGNQPMQTILIDDLVLIIEKIIMENYSGIFSIADPISISYKDFFTVLSQHLGIKPKFIFIPFSILDFFLSLTEFFHIKLPIARENVLGLRKAQVIDTKPDLEKLGVKISNYKESLLKIGGQ